MSSPTIIIGISLVVLGVGAWIIWRARKATEQKDFWKGIVVPLCTPFVVAILALGFGFFSEKQKSVEDDKQKKASLLQEVLASEDKPDIAFLTAVGDQLTLHLRRYQKILEKEKANATSPDQQAIQKLEKEKDFEETAAYFFFGMFRVALVHFYASKGYKLYSRLWMEEAFDRLANRVTELGLGDKKESDLDVSAIEEAALYKYFGAVGGTYQTSAQHAGEPTKTAALFDFYSMLTDPSDPKNAATSQGRLIAVLKAGFERFQGRLRVGGTRFISDTILTLDAITALDDYAFNKLFAVWYSGGTMPEEVEMLKQDIPGQIPKEPPKDFLFYPLKNQERKEWDANRKPAWDLIRKHVSPEFKAERNK